MGKKTEFAERTPGELAKANSEEQTVAERPSWLPVDLSDKELELCNALFDSYLFITPDKQGRTCVCSACRKTYRVEKLARLRTPGDAESLYAKQGYVIKCRECGRSVTVRWARISHSPIWSDRRVVFVRQLSRDEVRLDCYWLTKGYSQGVFDLPPRWGKEASYVLTPGKAVQYTRARRWYCKSQDDNDPDNWSRRAEDKVLLEPFSGCSYRVLDKHMLSGTFLHYHGLGEWNGIKGYNFEWCTVKYLCLRAKYPALEVLLKAGYKNIVEGFVERDRRYYRRLDLGATTPVDILKENRRELAALQSLGSEQEIAMMRHCKKKKSEGWQLSDIAALNECKVYLRSALTFCEEKKTSPRELAKYLRRQHERRMDKYREAMSTNGCMARHGGGIEPKISDVWHELEDFHAMYVQENGVPPREVFPKDVEAAHDALMNARDARMKKEKAARDKERRDGHAKRMKDQRERWVKTTADKVEAAQKIDGDKAKRERMDKRLRWRIKHLSFAEGDYMTVIPQATMELVREGEALHHCVGTYLESYAKGSTNIVFLRHREHLDQPLLTVEIDNDGFMKQCYGFDDDRTWNDEKEWMEPEREKYLAVYRTEIRAFAEHYEAYLAEHFARMKNKSKKKERVTA